MSAAGRLVVDFAGLQFRMRREAELVGDRQGVVDQVPEQLRHAGLAIP